MTPNLSIIIPCLNEQNTIADCLESVLNSVHSQGLLTQYVIEVLISDGGSNDATESSVEHFLKQAQTPDNFSIRFVASPEKGRAAQMNFGAEQAEGDALMFLHADTLLPKDYPFSRAIRLITNGPVKWGFSKVSFDSSLFRYKFLAFMINQRSRLTQIATGDQAIFCSKSTYKELGGFKNQRLMEDIELSKELKCFSQPLVTRQTVTTSARKWQQNGYWRTIFLMWKLRYQYSQGASAEEVYKAYYADHQG